MTKTKPQEMKIEVDGRLFKLPEAEQEASVRPACDWQFWGGRLGLLGGGRA